MTREEAIEILKSNYPDACFEQLRDAVDTAISALKQSDVPDINDGDMISRRAAIAEITEYGGSDIVYMSVGELKRRIKQLPSAQPERCEDCVNFNKTRLLIPQLDHIRCRDCKYAEFKPGATIHCKELGADLYQWDYCSYAERREE